MVDLTITLTNDQTKIALQAAKRAAASADRVDLGALDDAREATSADRVQTGLDRIATGRIAPMWRRKQRT